MTQNDAANIENAVGIHSVYLAVLKDEKLVGRYFHMEGEFLLYKDGRKVTKRQLADVMVYMAGRYGKLLTLEEVELGLLAVAKEYGELSGQDVQAVTEPPALEEPVEFIDQEPDDDEVVEMESTTVEDSDWVTDDYQADAPAAPVSNGRPGVKPDASMIEMMTVGDGRLTKDDAHISTFDLALRYYDFIANDLAKPDTEDNVQHKVKLAIGSTMKALGWKKRMRKGVYGWVPEDDSFFSDDPTAINPDNVVLRKRSRFVESDDLPQDDDVGTAESLPKLSDREEQDDKPQEQLDIDDDIPWSDVTDFTDGSPERKIEAVRFIDMIEGTEETENRELVFGKTYTFFLDDNGVERMVEWDKDERCWNFYIEEKAV